MWLWHFLQRISISPAGFASCLYSRLTVLSGLRKLGHPVPASNLSFARKSGLPQAAQWYVPPFSVSQYRPENAVSMLPCRIIRYRSGFSFFLNSSSFIAPRVGFEPTINSLTGSCVTITLPGNRHEYSRKWDKTKDSCKKWAHQQLTGVPKLSGRSKGKTSPLPPVQAA